MLLSGTYGLPRGERIFLPISSLTRDLFMSHFSAFSREMEYVRAPCEMLACPCVKRDVVFYRFFSHLPGKSTTFIIIGGDFLVYQQLFKGFGP